jgi:hypothetical protein
MDGRQFDVIARGIAGPTPRRRLLGGTLVGALAALSGGAVFAAKDRKKKGGNKNSDQSETDLPPGTLSGGIWDKTMQICHFDPDAGAYKVIAVPMTTVSDYFNQGDTPYVDCCDSSECGILPCLSPTGCIEGACMYDPVPDEACALEDGTTGVCDKDGVCVSGY